MSRKTTRAILMALAILMCSLAASAQKINKFIGSWDFQAPTAGYGYDFGIMEIEKESVITTFTGNSFKYPSDFVKYESDTFKFNFDVDGEYCECYLIEEKESNLIGFCEWPSGETKVTLVRRKTTDSAATKKE